MYCSECGVQNASGAKFCRACGEAFGQLPGRQRIVLVRGVSGRGGGERGKKRSAKSPNLADGIRNSIVGGGMLMTAFMLAISMPFPFLMAWFFLLLFVLVLPGLYLLGNGVAEIVRVKQQPRVIAPIADNSMLTPPAASARELTPHITSELVPPPSVTEEPTQRLGHKLSMN